MTISLNISSFSNKKKGKECARYQRSMNRNQGNTPLLWEETTAHKNSEK
jgi:hypothetical protein